MPDLITRTHTTLDGVDRTAVYSPCEKYRYSLLIRWDRTKNPKCFIGLNPSTATELEDDPTIRRCIDFARMWGAGGLLMLNACAYRATDPKVMLAYEGDKIGPSNTIRDLEHIIVNLETGPPIAAWGKHAAKVPVRWMEHPKYNRNDELRVCMGAMDCLGMNKDGTPVHPLYQPKTAVPIPYNYTRRSA